MTDPTFIPTNPKNVPFERHPFKNQIIMEDPVRGDADLMLFWRLAQPLKFVLAEIGPIPATLQLDKVPHGVQVIFPDIPEPYFERLAFRFLPFFQAKAPLRFLALIHQLARYNPSFRVSKHEFERQWQDAAFFGAGKFLTDQDERHAEEIISAAFRYTYGQVGTGDQARAEEFFENYGAVTYRSSYLSLIWNRATLVVQLADQIERALIKACILNHDDPQIFRNAYTSGNLQQNMVNE